MHVQIKYTLVGSMWGHIKVPGESVTVCTWDCHFPLHDEGVIRESAQSDYLCSGDQAHAQTFPPKMDMMSFEHHVMMYQWCGAFRWWHLPHIYTSHINGRTHGGRGSQFWNFKCRAHRAELIPLVCFGVSLHWVSQEFSTLQLQICVWFTD